MSHTRFSGTKLMVSLGNNPEVPFSFTSKMIKQLGEIGLAEIRYTQRFLIFRFSEGILNANPD